MFVLAAPLSAAACHAGPQYTAQHPETPAAYRGPAAPAAAPGVTADWWKGFGSPALDSLIADAEAGSFDIQAAVARIKQADAALRASGAALLPEIDLAKKASWQRSTSSGARVVSTGGGIALASSRQTTESRSFSLGPSVSYELDLWGALADTRDAAAAAALFSRYDKETVRLTVLTGVANAWFSALAFQDRIVVSERNLRDAEEILAAIRARQDAGTASLLDVSQQEALVAGIRAEMPNLRLQRDQQVAALAVLVGRLPEQIQTPTGTLAAITLPAVAPGLPSTLLARRPDVASAEANLLQQNANIRAARAAFFPTVSLTGSAGWQSSELATLLSPGSVLLSAAASATQVIFDNGKLTALFDQSQARNDELIADYRKAVVQAFVDVENALAGLRDTTEQERLEQDAVTTAQRAADIARAQVLAGTLDIVTALQTQTTLFNDLDQLAQARLARVQAQVSLYLALGGGWTQGDVVGPATPIYNGVL